MFLRGGDVTEQVVGTVENISFYNSDTGFAVVELSSEGELLTAVGEMMGVGEGQDIEIEGEYVTHPSFGMQLKVASFSCRMPQGATAVLRYLSAGVLPGIGASMARRIVERFGDDSLKIIDEDHEKLVEIKGMSLTKAAAASAEFKRVFGVRELIASLAKIGVNATIAINIYKSYGSQALTLVNENPYLLCDSPANLNFALADEIAASMNFEKCNSARLKAGVLYVLSHNVNNGHCCLPRQKLVATVSKFLDLEIEQIEETITTAVEQTDLVEFLCKEVIYIYLPEYFRGEMLVACHLKGLLAMPLQKTENVDKSIDRLELLGEITYAPLQRKAMATALTNNAIILTGGPGTGKTTTIKGIISLFEQQADTVFLAAPTGRAAKRMSELCGKEAKTIHRLLEVEFGSKETIRFVHNELNTLKCDVIILDEMSMVDLPLFESLLRAMRPQCKLVLVGDGNQLPSVGAGNLLCDMIESGVIPVVSLQDIFRQAAESKIIRTAHSIVEGEVTGKNEKEGDFFLLEATPRAAQELLVDIVSKRLPQAYGFDAIKDVQVLCPSKIGLCGTMALNTLLQNKLNPQAENKAELKFMGNVYRVGDKVMQVRNNYDIVYDKLGGGGTGAFNGDMGIIIHVDAPAQSITLNIDDKIYRYSGEHLKQLELAYAVTIHKSQGCEFPAVVLPVTSDTPTKLRYRNLIYTGVTRAKSLLILCGSRQTFGEMVANDRRTLRYSCIAEILKDESIC